MINRDKLKEILQKNRQEQVAHLSQYAAKEEQAYRQTDETDDFMRSPFAIDRDRILYSGAYRRYQGKTQVFSFTNMFDEEMTNRSLHTTYVSQIARTIGRNLGLNQELIEAIALGHDLGHTPFGHDGEVALSACCQKNGIGHFHHNIQSLNVVDYITKRGGGMNLTFQVRDGIISHDGEVHNTKLTPDWDKTETEIKAYIAAKKKGEKLSWMPATMEGCVVRISDTIAYIGQDIEDAIRYKILDPEEIPHECTDYLGKSNGQIIDTLVQSVILNSYGQDYVAFDPETSQQLLKLKKFNYQRIYTNQHVKNAKVIINKSMNLMFEQYLEDLAQKRAESKIFLQFLNHKNQHYISDFNDAEKVRDFISTMTDRYFNEEVKHYLLPGRYL
ncbi:MAG: HD domain-containing protein [Candidatus Cloacimonadales bacterium]